MNGTVRILIGFLLLLGGVGGIENSPELFPTAPLLIAIGGLILLASGAIASARQDERERMMR